jgi:excisionase family DNA binding protein
MQLSGGKCRISSAPQRLKAPLKEPKRQRNGSATAAQNGAQTVSKQLRSFPLQPPPPQNGFPEMAVFGPGGASEGLNRTSKTAPALAARRNFLTRGRPTLKRCPKVLKMTTVKLSTVEALYLDGVLSRREAAKYLRISTRTLDKLAKAGKIGFSRITADRKYAIRALNAYLARHHVGPV